MNHYLISGLLGSKFFVALLIKFLKLLHRSLTVLRSGYCILFVVWIPLFYDCFFMVACKSKLTLHY